MKKIDQFTQAYIECALWSSTDNADKGGGEPLDANYDQSDLAPSTLQEMIDDCADFRESNAKDLAESGLDDGRAGHDFWLTRNGHGAGFWDEGLGAVGTRLSDAAKIYGSYDLLVGDNGHIFGC